MDPKDTARINGWHLHIYYTPETRDKAAALREWVEERFTVRMGGWHDAHVGPHTRSMYQVAFTPDVFPTLVPFVMLNRQGLAVLLHPETGRQLDDHTLHATWMGEVLPLKTDVLPVDS